MTHSCYISQLFKVADHNQHRYLIDLFGEEEWVDLILQTARLSQSKTSQDCIIKLGGKPLKGINTKPHNFGTKLLGTELKVLIFDCIDGFDANSFAAACGTVVGGGMVFLINFSTLEVNLGVRWLRQHLKNAIQLSQFSVIPRLPEKISTEKYTDYHDQSLAIEAIEKVVKGKRKRPLVMISDRGRGKSSALGIAAAKIMLNRKVTILITAPSIHAVTPVFEHALRVLGDTHDKFKNRIESNNGSCLRFVAPDDLLSSQLSCDFLIVDEASAIPIPILISMCHRYHRMVFSTTVHGYEGCGRGFTLKFTDWLKKHRSGWHSIELNQPIRWSKFDPLEAWLFDAFLLNSELEDFGDQLPRCENLFFVRQNKTSLIEDKILLKRCFGLLVNAHYQTSPNDIFQILNDPNVELWLMHSNKNLVGVLTTIREGNLSSDIINQIVHGKRRPKGHLVPSNIVNHLGYDEAALQKSARIMRIAVHPHTQRQGIGKKMLSVLKSTIADVDYLSTSFGSTAELLSFWQDNHYKVVRVGHSRDQASGCHSVIMVLPVTELCWINSAVVSWQNNFIAQLSHGFRGLEEDLVCQFFSQWTPHTSSLSQHQMLMLSRYANGGNGNDSIRDILIEFLIFTLPKFQHADLYPLISVFLQQLPWGDVIAKYQFSGKKSLDEYLRARVFSILSDLHCKFENKR